MGDDEPNPTQASATKLGKDAKLAAALRANLARRKLASRRARTGEPSSKSTDQES